MHRKQLKARRVKFYATQSRALRNIFRIARSAKCLRALCLVGNSGAGTRWNAVPVNILEPKRRSGKYRWPQVER